jgi:hypothetical protein
MMRPMATADLEPRATDWDAVLAFLRAGGA